MDSKYNAFRAAAEQMLRSAGPGCLIPNAAAITVLARDLQDLSDELDTSGYAADIGHAMVEMRRRIGGNKNLAAYVA
jgi:hypothetical protein